MEENKKKKLPLILTIIGLFILAFGITFAFFTITLNGTKKVKITTGTLKLRLLDANDNYVDELNTDADTGFDIELNNAVPMSVDDAEARNDNVYTFKVKNEGTIRAKYTISLEDLELESGDTRLEDKYIRYTLDRDDDDEIAYNKKLNTLTNRELDFGLIEPNQVHTYTLRLWIDNSAGNAAMNKTFYAHIKLDGEQTKIENERELSITNLKVSNINNNTETNATYTEPTKTITDNTFTISNLNATVYSVGDKVTYSFTLTNSGLYDLSFDVISNSSAYNNFQQCEGHNNETECKKWDFDNSGQIGMGDKNYISDYFNTMEFNIPETLSPGESVTITSSVEFYSNDFRSPYQQRDKYEFYNKDLVVKY